MENLFSEINQICSIVFENPKLKLKLSDTPIEIDGWDSLTHVQLVAEIEKRFNVKFNFKELASIRTIEDMVTITEAKIKNNQSNET